MTMLLVIFDGIETYNSYNRDCGRCSTRIIKTNNGQRVQYYHRAVLLTLVGFDFQIPIGSEMIRKGEDEVSCSINFVRIFDSFHKR